MFKEYSCSSLSFFCGIFLSTLFKQLADLVIHTITITEKHSMVYAMTTDGLLRTTSSEMQKNAWPCYLPYFRFNCNVSFISSFFLGLVLAFTIDEMYLIF